SFVAVMVVSFHYVGRHLVVDDGDAESSFLAWAVGSALFAIAVTSVSISYFDQSILWLYMTMAFCGALATRPSPLANEACVPVASAAAHRASHRARRRRLAIARSSVDLASPHPRT